MTGLLSVIGCRGVVGRLLIRSERESGIGERTGLYRQEDLQMLSSTADYDSPLPGSDSHFIH